MVIGCGSSPDSGSDRDSSGPASVDQAATESASSTPDFSLLSTNGGVVSFGDLRGVVPVGLFFYGGADCDGCEDRLRLLQDSYHRFQQLGAELIAVSTDAPEKTRMTVDRAEIEFPVLSDVDGTVSQSWGVFNVLSNGHAAPAIVLFGPSGNEIARRVSTSADQLPDIEEMLQTFQRSLESATTDPTPTPSADSAGGPAAPVLLGPGVTDFRLPDAINGGEVSLSETIRERNVVLVFYRAFW